MSISVSGTPIDGAFPSLYLSFRIVSASVFPSLKPLFLLVDHYESWQDFTKWGIIRYYNQNKNI